MHRASGISQWDHLGDVRDPQPGPPVELAAGPPRQPTLEDMKREFQELQARRGPWEELHSPASGNRVRLHTTSNLIVRDIPQEVAQRLRRLQELRGHLNEHAIRAKATTAAPQQNLSSAPPPLAADHAAAAPVGPMAGPAEPAPWPPGLAGAPPAPAAAPAVHLAPGAVPIPLVPPLGAAGAPAGPAGTSAAPLALGTVRPPDGAVRPGAPVDPRAHAQLSTWDEAKSAHTAWLAKAHEAVGNKRAAKLVLTFATQCHSEVDMHNVMVALGVHILPPKSKPSHPAPCGVPRGDNTQPAVEVTWSLSPKQTMMFQLVNRGAGRVLARACRTVISEHIEELLYLFGPVQSVVPSVPEPRAELVSAAAPARLSARQALGAPASAACLSARGPMEPEAAPLDSLRTAVTRWLESEIRPFERAAALKDARAVGHALVARGVDICVLPGPWLSGAVRFARLAEQRAFKIALVDAETGQALDPSDMLARIEEDLFARVRNDFPFDEGAAIAQRDLVTSIRAAGGGPELASPLGAQEPLYTMREVDDMLDALKPTSAALKKCDASLKSPVPMGWRLTRAVANISRHCGLTSNLWSARQISPLHKSGPRVVRQLNCLLPISISTLMASVVDGLWTSRNRRRLEAYCGVAQQGGVGDPLVLLIALLLHAQCRVAQGLPIYWAVTDLQWAFDVASHLAMLINAHLAGVRGTDSLLLEDFIASDRQFVALQSLASSSFELGGGTAQGRRFSVPVFNAQLKWLYHEVGPRPWFVRRLNSMRRLRGRRRRLLRSTHLTLALARGSGS
ncbi:unnamed protein product [Prorocentrum cordatum]|uniref:Reverse transcriptase domain-containing protein n=1 Tax=Prorocentrum cordatum TaxID=2364126 RepID=A0ABN9UPZ5_9DINO|nr:unnamed protein product [Polarella glacialis]